MSDKLNEKLQKLDGKNKKNEAKYDTEGDELFAKIKVAREAITKKHGKGIPKEFIQGKIKCPLCKNGKRVYTISDYNGHIHSCCTTEKCVKWME